MPYRALTSFRTVDKDGKPVRVGVGEVVEDKNPLVKSHKQLFEPVEDYHKRVQEGKNRTFGPVEKATAAPDEKRAVEKPKKKKDDA